MHLIHQYNLQINRKLCIDNLLLGGRAMLYAKFSGHRGCRRESTVVGFEYFVRIKHFSPPRKILYLI